MICSALAGKRILLTGATGFLGTALFERLLVHIPVERLDLLIRGDAQARMVGMLAGSAFGPAVHEMGSARLAELAREKVTPIPIDLAHDIPSVADDIDLVIHTAATVSFDPPIDEAFASNLGATTRLYQAAGGRPFIHVSTAYVAGLTKGVQREEPLALSVDWREEAEAASLVRADVERASREVDVLHGLDAKARGEMSRAGPQSVARRAEELRREWMRDRLVRSGFARAQSLGWPDVYTFTKALTESALQDLAGDLAGDNALSIIRPSIIESALAWPYPGWIEGFRMAEPVILAYGQARFPEFTGIPDGVIDIIPVDLVANAILAVSAAVSAGKPEARGIYHVCSGGRNPLRYRGLYELTREYFLDHPLPARARGSYRVPDWKFPGRRVVDGRLRAADWALGRAERIVDRLPTSRAGREATRQVDRLRRRLDFMKRYADLYGPYTEIESIYTDERAAALFRSLAEEDRRTFCFDPTSFTWRSYLHDIHLPMITAPLRWLPPRRPEPKVAIAPDGDGRPVLAVFDIEACLAETNVVEAYMWLRLSEQGPGGRARQIAAMAARAPRLLAAERRDRGEFLRRFYRLYRGVSADAVRELAARTLDDLFLRRLAPAGVRRIREHRAAGHRVVFLTASADFLMQSLAPLADELVTGRLKEKGGVFTGDLDLPPVVGEARASWLHDYAREHGADLSACYVYADATSDLPMMEVVGNPVAVNPDAALERVARVRRWPIERWHSDPGTPRVLVPPGVR